MGEALRPLPPVGARIKFEHQHAPTSPQNWLRAGLVIAVAEGEAMLVRRWLPKKARYVHLAVTIHEWQWDAYRRVLNGRVRVADAARKSQPRWVALAACDGLPDGKYTVRNAACAFIGHWHNGWWAGEDVDPVEVTHVLSPELGPIPEVQ